MTSIPPEDSEAPITEEYGVLPDGRAVARHVLRSAALELHVLELGATVQELRVLGAPGGPRNIVLGHPTVEDRLASTAYLGATIGRYANRIAGGRFPVGDTVHTVPTHDRGNALHGGPEGFDVQLWETRELTASRCVLAHTSPRDHQGYPGELAVTVTFEVDGDTVRIDHEATTDAPTPVNLTNHSNLNLAGEGSGTVDDHLLQVEADHYLPTDAVSIPLAGDPAPVDGTPFDLREPRRIGDVVRRDHPQLLLSRGLDHDLVLRGTGHRRVATVEAAGLRLDLYTDQVGLQVYTGNFLDGTAPGTGGGRYRQGDGLALEPQAHPDSPNRRDHPSVVLTPDRTYHSRIEWRISSASQG